MPELKRGDIFCTLNPMMLGRLICWIQRFNDVDDRAAYSHAGLITNPHGGTFEALWTNRRQNLFTAYAGEQVLIARHADMTIRRFQAGWEEVEHLQGRWYAGHRLLLHLVPPLAKYLSTGQFAVCSELVAKFLVGAGLLTFWAAVTPDMIADMMWRWNGWKIVFEGVLPATLAEFKAYLPPLAAQPEEAR